MPSRILAHGSADDYTPLIAILTMRRMALRLSQAELNARIGMADNHLAKWEAKMHTPRPFALQAWAEALGYRLSCRRR